MGELLSSPGRALGLGLALTLIGLVLWIAFEGVDGLGLASVLARYLHVLAAMIWVGLIWFVNLVQLRALGEADDNGRRVLLAAIVPRVAAAFRHASHVTVLTGLLLLVTTGYLFGGTVFSASVFVPPVREIGLWLGVAGGLAMWGIVHLLIWRNLKIVLAIEPGDAEAKAMARAAVATWARINLVLALPVTFAMVAAAHLA